MANPHSRMTSVETAITSDGDINEADITPLSASNPQLARMMDQIQADIHLKEELVTQLEKSEMEYGQLRKRFENKLYSLSQEILNLRREREKTQATLQQHQHQLQQQHHQNRRSSIAGGSSANGPRDHQQIHDVRHAYEAKMKTLLNQLSDLRRKYSQTSSAIQSSRNQNESMLRALRVNVESLKVEKKRMVKRMKDEADRVKEQILAHQREIQQLRRKQSRHNESKHRMERETRQLQRMLQKRTDESTVTNERLKQLVGILKKAVCEGGILDDKMISKCAGFLNLSQLKATTSTRQQRRSPSNGSRKKNEYSKVPLEVRASKKKRLLDQALLQFIQGKQAILEMQQLMVKRDVLAGEKSEIMMERADLLQGNQEVTDTLDIAVQQCMDERLETIGAEINYINARICGLQNDAAHGLLNYGDDVTGEEEEDDDLMLALEEQSMTSSLANRIEKRVTFADEVIGNSPATTTGVAQHKQQQTQVHGSKTSATKNVAATTADCNNGWHDIDYLEEKYTVPLGCDPDTAHDMAMQLLQSLTGDESNKVMESLIDDIVALRMDEYGRQTTVRQLEKTVQDLRCTLFVMRKAANNSAAENQKKILKLKRVRRTSVSSMGEASMSSASSVIQPPKRISATEPSISDDDDDSAIDLRVDEHYQHSGTIFDKIYNDGIRGAIMSPTWNEYHSRNGKENSDDNGLGTTTNSSGSVESAPQQRQSSNTSEDINISMLDLPFTDSRAPNGTVTTEGSSTDGPIRPLISPLVGRRDSMSSPEQFLQQVLPNNNTGGKDGSSRGPAEFLRYHADRDSSTSSINSHHIRRSSLQSDTLSLSSHGSSQQVHHHLYHQNALPPPLPHHEVQQQHHHQYPIPPISHHQQQQRPQLTQPPNPAISSSLANRRRALSLQLNQYPTKVGRRRSLLKELTQGVNIRDAAANNANNNNYGDLPATGCHQPSPLQQQFRFNTSSNEHYPIPRQQNSIQHQPYQYANQPQQQHHQRPASAFAFAPPRNKYQAATQMDSQKLRSQTPTAGSSIFDRLAASHTQASQAKRSPSSLGYRHSSGSFEEIQRRWEYEQSV